MTAGPAAAEDRAVSRADRAALLGVSAFAAVVSFWGLGGKPFTSDETATVSAVQRPLGELFAVLHATDAVLAAYYVLLHAWAQPSSSETWLRVPSALAGVAVVALTWRIATRFTGGAWPSVAALVVAVNPALVLQEHQARPYTMALAAALAAVAAFVRPRPRWWLGTLAWVVAGYLHLFVCLVAPAALAGCVLRRDLSVRRAALLLAVGVAGLLPVLALAFAQRHQVTEHVGEVTLRSVAGLGANLAGGLIPLLAWVVAVAVLVAVALRARSHGALWPRGAPLVAALVGPPLMLGLVSTVTPVLVPRYVLGAVPVAAASLAVMASRTEPPSVTPTRAVLALIVLASLVSTVRFLAAPNYQLDFRAAAALIAGQARPGDVLVFDPPWYRRGLLLYGDRPGRNRLPADILVADSAEVAKSLTAREVPAAQIPARIHAAERVWLVIGARHGRPLFRSKQKERVLSSYRVVSATPAGEEAVVELLEPKIRNSDRGLGS